MVHSGTPTPSPPDLNWIGSKISYI
uniref:Uncharacterized protein n=1 Tax=Anguilla anguilla TaxID=7936 RepID=A0A0E9SJX3_ANGAN